MGKLLVTKCLVPKRTEYGKRIRKDYESHRIYEPRGNMTVLTPRDDGCINTLTTILKDNYLLEIYAKCDGESLVL